MRSTRRAAATVAVTGSLVAALLAAAGTANGAAELRLSSAGAANPKAPGLTSPNRLSPELAAIVRAQGSGLVENPQDGIGYYGVRLGEQHPTADSRARWSPAIR